MKYCPACRAEYRDAIDLCADCNERLISQGEFERRKAEEEQFLRDTATLVKVFTLSNKFEADVISRELEKEGIPFLIRNFKDTAYDGIYIPQKGWGEVRVAEKEKQRALDLITALEADWEAGRVSISDSEQSIGCPFCGVEIPLESKVCPACKKKLGNEI